MPDNTVSQVADAFNAVNRFASASNAAANASGNAADKTRALIDSLGGLNRTVSSGYSAWYQYQQTMYDIAKSMGLTLREAGKLEEGIKKLTTATMYSRQEIAEFYKAQANNMSLAALSTAEYERVIKLTSDTFGKQGAEVMRTINSLSEANKNFADALASTGRSTQSTFELALEANAKFGTEASLQFLRLTDQRATGRTGTSRYLESIQGGQRLSRDIANLQLSMGQQLGPGVDFVSNLGATGTRGVNLAVDKLGAYATSIAAVGLAGKFGVGASRGGGGNGGYPYGNSENPSQGPGGGYPYGGGNAGGVANSKLANTVVDNTIAFGSSYLAGKRIGEEMARTGKDLGSSFSKEAGPGLAAAIAAGFKTDRFTGAAGAAAAYTLGVRQGFSGFSNDAQLDEKTARILQRDIAVSFLQSMKEFGQSVIAFQRSIAQFQLSVGLAQVSGKGVEVVAQHLREMVPARRAFFERTQAQIEEGVTANLKSMQIEFRQGRRATAPTEEEARAAFLNTEDGRKLTDQLLSTAKEISQSVYEGNVFIKQNLSMQRQIVDSLLNIQRTSGASSAILLGTSARSVSANVDTLVNLHENVIKYAREAADPKNLQGAQNLQKALGEFSDAALKAVSSLRELANQAAQLPTHIKQMGLVLDTRASIAESLGAPPEVTLKYQEMQVRQAFLETSTLIRQRDEFARQQRDFDNRIPNLPPVPEQNFGQPPPGPENKQSDIDKLTRRAEALYRMRANRREAIKDLDKQIEFFDWRANEYKKDHAEGLKNKNKADLERYNELRETLDTLKSSRKSLKDYSDKKEGEQRQVEKQRDNMLAENRAAEKNLKAWEAARQSGDDAAKGGKQFVSGINEMTKSAKGGAELMFSLNQNIANNIKKTAQQLGQLLSYTGLTGAGIQTQMNIEHAKRMTEILPTPAGLQVQVLQKQIEMDAQILKERNAKYLQLLKEGKFDPENAIAQKHYKELLAAQEKYTSDVMELWGGFSGRLEAELDKFIHGPQDILDWQPRAADVARMEIPEMAKPFMRYGYYGQPVSEGFLRTPEMFARGMNPLESANMPGISGFIKNPLPANMLPTLPTNLGELLANNPYFKSPQDFINAMAGSEEDKATQDISDAIVDALSKIKNPIPVTLERSSPGNAPSRGLPSLILPVP